MKNRYLLLVFLLLIKFNLFAQVLITPDGIMFSNGEKYIIIENNNSASENMNMINKAIKTNSQSIHIKIEQGDDFILITNYIHGYTKTDKLHKNAYLLDLSYKIMIDIKDNQFRIHTPIIDISAIQRYQDDSLSEDKIIQFRMTMKLKGKRDFWNTREVQLFIYNENGDLIEKSTKEKLEYDLSSIIKIITESEINTEW